MSATKSSKTSIPESAPIWDWQRIQGTIVTGGGKVSSHSNVYSDFLPSDLPHYLIIQKVSRQAFHRWKTSGRTTDMLVGCWSRPIFLGGWMESSWHDTDAYNLQTPSLFIDMRFPTVHRPEEVMVAIRQKRSLSECSDLELRLLSRQHCFSGYSLLEHNPLLPNPGSAGPSKPPMFTRHHIIDWNFLSLFPRNRPNRWWVEIQQPSSDSFKEYSFVRDEYNVPVYCERWQRRDPLSNQREKYLALRKVRPCPASEEGKRRALDRNLRDVVLVVTGNHYAIAIDRYWRNINKYLEDFRDNTGAKGNGGGGFFVDYLLNQAIEAREGRGDGGDERLCRSVLIDYLDLEGSYGMIRDIHGTELQDTCSWRVHKSTHPWKEGKSLFANNDYFEFDFEGNQLKCLRWLRVPGNVDPTVERVSCIGEWQVFECSYSEEELRDIFPTKVAALRAKL